MRQEEWREASCELYRPGNEALGLPCSANCSLHEDACFPNASFHQHISSLTFVKPLLLLRVNLSVFKMACSFYPPSLMEMWKVWVTPFHKESCQGPWLQSDFSSGKKSTSENLTNGDYSIIILLYRNKRGHTREKSHQMKSWRWL